MKKCPNCWRLLLLDDAEEAYEKHLPYCEGGQKVEVEKKFVPKKSKDGKEGKKK